MNASQARTLRVALVCLTALGVSAPSRARAQVPGSEGAAAEVLYNEGRRLLEEGNATAACPKLEESMRLDPGMGTQFFLGACYEAIGRTASAWATFRDVESAARTAGRRDRQELAKKRADALDPKLIRLQIEVPWDDAVPGVEVRRGGVLVGHGQWGMPLPIDPGVTVIHVSAPSKVAIDISVDLREPGKTRVVTIPALADAPKTVAVPGEGPGGETSSIRTAGWVTAGVGAAGVVTSGVLGLLAKSKFNASKASCNANGDCTDPSDVDGRKKAVSLASTGTVVFVSSIVVVAAGVAIALFMPTRTSARSARITYDGALGGTF